MQTLGLLRGHVQVTACIPPAREEACSREAALLQERNRAGKAGRAGRAGRAAAASPERGLMMAGKAFLRVP